MSDLHTRIADAIDQKYNEEAVGHTYEVCLLAANAAMAAIKGALSREYDRGYFDGLDEGWFQGWDDASGH